MPGTIELERLRKKRGMRIIIRINTISSSQRRENNTSHTYNDF
jgi:hypothetical protein